MQSIATRMPWNVTKAKREQEAREQQQLMLQETAKKKAEQAALAETLDHWLNTDIGVAFTARIKSDRQSALNALATVAPSDLNMIMELQQKAATVSRIQHYIAEILHALKTN
jgi:hypothetical protein